MAYDSRFDVDAVLSALGTVNEQYKEGSLKDEALRVAAVALLYLRETQQLEDYREFFRKFYSPAVEAVLVSHTFATREEADVWLAGGMASDGELVRIVGQGFRVIDGQKGLRFLRTPLPEEMESTK
jgi:hypothetical protein